MHFYQILGRSPMDNTVIILYPREAKSHGYHKKMLQTNMKMLKMLHVQN